MIKGFVISCFAAAVISAFVAVPAKAQDAIEAKAAACSGCHGQNGVPINAMTPVIWGQKANYLYKELHDFHSGDRTSAIMAALVKPHSLPDLRSMANYFADKTWPAKQSTAAAGAAPAEAARCTVCHGQNFEGGAPAPRLAGLSYEYLVGAMKSFANGERTNNGDMPEYMTALTDAQREAIAHYLAAL